MLRYIMTNTCIRRKSFLAESFVTSDLGQGEADCEATMSFTVHFYR